MFKVIENCDYFNMYRKVPMIARKDILGKPGFESWPLAPRASALLLSYIPCPIKQPCLMLLGQFGARRGVLMQEPQPLRLHNIYTL